MLSIDTPKPTRGLDAFKFIVSAIKNQQFKKITATATDVHFYMQSSNKSTTVDYNTKIIYFGLKNITVDSLISVSPRRVKNVLLTST